MSALSPPPASEMEQQIANNMGGPGANSASWQLDFSNLECTSMIASGAFGSVYRGTLNKHAVAIKFLNLPDNLTKQQQQQFQTQFTSEVTVWHGLKHKNIVQFLGASMTGENISSAPGLTVNKHPGKPMWGIVTEFLGGGTLNSFLQKRNGRRLTLEQIVSMALDIARGLEYLHSRNIVHRDIKSDNLLLTEERPTPTVKIADFGVARVEATNAADMTMETGTVRWMAPEIIDHKPYTKKVDAYSFAIILWQLVAVQHPYREYTFVQLAFAVVNNGVRPEIPESTPPVLANLMRACWDANPDRRPDFPEVVRILESIDTNPDPPAKRGTGCLCQ